MIKRILIRVAVFLSAALLLAVLGFVWWGSNPSRPLPQAQQALLNDGSDGVTVREMGGSTKWLDFASTSTQPDTGLIFYPGGRVDYRSYAPMARAIAAQGYRVIIVPMPLSLAVFGVNRAADVQLAYPEIRHWAIGGHSLGGAMAAQFAFQNPGKVQGLVLWAAYPADGSSLADADLKVVSIYASQDGLATGAKVDAGRPLLPSATTYVSIQGGNHAQFGWYGPQSGDGTASISPEEQQSQTVAATIGLLREIDGR